MIEEQNKRSGDLYKQIEELIKNKIDENNQMKEKSKYEFVEKNKKIEEKKELINTVNKKIERKNIKEKEEAKINIKNSSKKLRGLQEKPNLNVNEQKKEIVDKQQINKKKLLNAQLEKRKEIIKLTDDYMKTRLEKGIKNIILFSIGSHITTRASVPFIIHNAFINICALSLGTNVLIDETNRLKEGNVSKWEKRKNQKKNKKKKKKDQSKKVEKIQVYEEEDDDIDLEVLF